MSEQQKGLLVVSGTASIIRLSETFTIEKTYEAPLNDLTFTHIYVAEAFSHDVRQLKTGYIGRIKSINISSEEKKWKHIFILSGLLTVSKDFKGRPCSTEKTGDGEIFNANFELEISKALSASEEMNFTVNNNDGVKLLTITDAIEQLSKSYGVTASQIKICING